MTGLTTFEILSFTLLFIIHLDFVAHFCLTKFWELNIEYKERIIINKKKTKTEQQQSFFWVFLICILLLFTKFSINCNYDLINWFVLLIFTLFTIIILLNMKYIRINSQNYDLKFINFIFQIFFFIFFSLTLATNFLTLFFLMELLATCYYFFFLTTFSSKSKNFINKFKNLLILYLWNSFWTSIIYILFLTATIYYYGTLNFDELYLVYSPKTWFIAYGFFFSLFLKLGLPFFHFYKLQIYYFFDLKLIFFYSIVTTVTNLIFLIILSNLPIFSMLLFQISTTGFIICGMFLVIINSFKNWTILNLLMYSSITIFVIMLFLLF